MKVLLLSLLLAVPIIGTAQATHPHHRASHRPAVAPAASAAPRVYICGGGSAYAYHSSGNCAVLNRCSHGVTAVSVTAAETMGRRPCTRCY